MNNKLDFIRIFDESLDADLSTFPLYLSFKWKVGKLGNDSNFERYINQQIGPLLNQESIDDKLNFIHLILRDLIILSVYDFKPKRFSSAIEKLLVLNETALELKKKYSDECSAVLTPEEFDAVEILASKTFLNKPFRSWNSKPHNLNGKNSIQPIHELKPYFDFFKERLAELDIKIDCFDNRRNPFRKEKNLGEFYNATPARILANGFALIGVPMSEEQIYKKLGLRP